MLLLQLLRFFAITLDKRNYAPISNVAVYAIVFRADGNDKGAYTWTKAGYRLSI